MAELTLTAFITLDGVVQAPGGPDEDRSGGFEHGGWIAPLFGEADGAVIDEIFAKADAFMLGRRTYDIFASYWPKVDDPDNPVALSLNTLPKFVASRTRSTFDWAGTEHVSDVVAEVPAIKRRFEREVQVHGSGGLAQTLLRHDLVDEIRLFTFPIVIGSGKRLFGEGAVPRTFELVRSTSTASGTVIGFYRRAGGLVTGTVE